jgi:hypothetical protein
MRVHQDCEHVTELETDQQFAARTRATVVLKQTFFDDGTALQKRNTVKAKTSETATAILRHG